MTNSAATSATVSVIIAAHTFERCEHLTRAVDSAFSQRPQPYEVIVAVDNNPDLYEWVCKKMPDVVTVDHRGPKGASGTRNSGARASGGDVLAFLDDDAVASPNWLENLIAPLARPDVAGVGGHVDPVWLGQIPRWLPEEFLWIVGATYRGMPRTAAPVRNVWSENMAVARDDFWKIDGFREGFGKTGLESPAGEDTDFCIRLTAATGGRIWWYEPTARIGHIVPPSRGTRRFFIQRCYREGQGKAVLTALLGAHEVMQDERRHATKTLPQGILRELRLAAGGEFVAAQRALAIAVGLGAASLGYMVQSTRRVR